MRRAQIVVDQCMYRETALGENVQNPVRGSKRIAVGDDKQPRRKAVFSQKIRCFAQKSATDFHTLKVNGVFAAAGTVLQFIEQCA